MTSNPLRYTYFNSGNLFSIHQRELLFFKLLKGLSIQTFQDKKILDIGCGTGGELRRFIQYGAKPENIVGFDLNYGRVKEAKDISPNVLFLNSNAVNLPFPDESFDIVSQFTVFSSILSTQERELAAKEMKRVLKKKGVIVFYDFHFSNPKNKHIRPVKRSEIKHWFVGYDIKMIRTTLYQPLRERIAPFSWLLCYLLESVKIFNTHYICVIRRKNESNH
ncbi:MAG: class I SAM-dependent methyltransferase [Calditerrivibrio sp.]|nr:class I SAM-dependent methyltransferase [Calditerrivibrio sp.]